MPFTPQTLTLTSLGTATVDLSGIGPLATVDNATVNGGFPLDSDKPLFIVSTIENYLTNVCGGQANWLQEVGYYDLATSSPEALVTQGVTPDTVFPGGTNVDLGLTSYAGGFETFRGIASLGNLSVSSVGGVGYVQGDYFVPGLGEVDGSALTSHPNGTYGIGTEVFGPAVNTPYALGATAQFAADDSGVLVDSGGTYTTGYSFLPGINGQDFDGITAISQPLTDPTSGGNATILFQFQTVGPADPPFIATAPLVEILDNSLTLQGDYYLSFGADTTTQVAWDALNNSDSPAVNSTRSGLIFSDGTNFWLVDLFGGTYTKILFSPQDTKATAAISSLGTYSQNISADAAGNIWVSNGGITAPEATEFYVASGTFSANLETIYLATATGTLGGTVFLTGTTNYGPPAWIDVSLDGGETWTVAEFYQTADGTIAAPYNAVGPDLEPNNG